MSVKPIPDGYHSVTPYLIVRGAAQALDFYKRAFNAVELFRMPDPTGRIGHAEFQIGDSRLMMADEFPEMGFRSPKALGGTPMGLMIYVPNMDAMFDQAVAAGAKVVKAPKDQFYGDRNGTVEDPFGHQWTLATHVKDVPMDEIMKHSG